MSASDDGQIEIRHFAIRNLGPGGGWLPMVTNNGRRLGGDWSTYGYLREEAEQAALEKAREEAGRYCGDWTIAILPGETVVE